MANSNDIVITPKDQLLAIDWKEVWRYRDMYVLFVQRAFRTAYKQTILGPLWFLITPVLSVIVYVAVLYPPTARLQSCSICWASPCGDTLQHA